MKGNEMNCKHEHVFYDVQVDAYYCTDCERYVSTREIENRQKLERK